jgi:hypothetical protein
MTLYQFTFTVNLFALLTALWLGLYIVIRNPRAQTAWLTALTLWSLGGLFLNILLALSPPPDPAFRPSSLRFLFPFWPSGMFEQGANAWLQGWSVVPSVAFWHHATMLMRPGKMNAWRWTRVLFAYVIAAIAIEVQAFTQILFSVEGGDPLYLNSLRAGPLYPIFGLALIGLTVMCVINLARSAYVAPNEIIRRQLMTLVTATVITGLIAPVSIVSSGLDLFPMPMAVMSIVLTVFVVTVGYGVARHSALVKKRTIERDFLYNLIGTTVMASLYIAAAWILVFAYRAPKVIVIFFPLLGVLMHTGLNAASIFLDWFFYRDETRRLRANLHELRRMAGESDNIKLMLEQILEALCDSIHATYGLIVTFQNGTARPIAQRRWKWGELELPVSLLAADDVVHLSPGHFAAPLEEAALLVPLYIEAEQIGMLVLGRPANGIQYAPEDVELLLYPADQIADALHIHRRTTAHLKKVEQIAKESPAPSTALSRMPVDTIDLALRNLFDYAYLADSQLAELEIVRRQLGGDKKTHIERGKVVQAVILKALDKLRPGPEVPPEPVPREWYPYIILHDAYVAGIQNRDIMSKLYISEGTFNRTRRNAIRSLARVLAEMEHSV